VAYHAEPFRNPRSIRVKFSEASSTQHFIVDPGLVQGLTLAFFTLKTSLESCILVGS